MLFKERFCKHEDTKFCIKIQQFNMNFEGSIFVGRMVCLWNI